MASILFLIAVLPRCAISTALTFCGEHEAKLSKVYTLFRQQGENRIVFLFAVGTAGCDGCCRR